MCNFFKPIFQKENKVCYNGKGFWQKTKRARFVLIAGDLYSRKEKNLIGI